MSADLHRFLGLVLLASAVSCGPPDQSRLYISAAANSQYAAEEIVAAFEEKTGIDCEIILSSSGKLTAQIKAGAPYDIFLSADMRYPERLHQEGLTKARPEVYAYGKLVLWSMVDTPSIEGLAGAESIALANPDIAPYGRAAMEVLGALELEQKRLVYGESVTQTNQFIVSRAATIGFTAKSSLTEAGYWIDIPPQLYQPIEQGVVVLKTEKSEQAQKFKDYLFSKEAQKILQEFGYSIDE